jgi:hypothetical protein
MRFWAVNSSKHRNLAALHWRPAAGLYLYLKHRYIALHNNPLPKSRANTGTFPEIISQ